MGVGGGGEGGGGLMGSGLGRYGSCQCASIFTGGYCLGFPTIEEHRLPSGGQNNGIYFLS